MKIHRKKYLITFVGSGIILGLPIMTTISCSTSWTKWNIQEPSKRPETTFQHNRTDKENLWQVRTATELNAAWQEDETNTVIDLAKLNNQYELITLLGNKLNFNSEEQIDAYWNQPIKMKNYVKQLTPTINNIKLVFGEKEDIIDNLDLSNEIINITTDIDYFLTLPTEKHEDDPEDQEYQNTYKAFDVEEEGLDPKTDIPIRMDKVAPVGVNLMTIPMVRALTKVDAPNFALKLSKLVNLPKKAFLGFQDIIQKLNDFWEDIFETTSFNSWVDTYKIDFEIQSNSFYYSEKANDPLDHVRAQFLVLTLKK